MTPAAEQSDFQLIAGHPVLDLVNTLDWRFLRHGEAPEAPVEMLASYNDLLFFVEASGMWTTQLTRQLLGFAGEPEAERVLVRVRQLREACAGVLYSAINKQEQSEAAHKTLARMFRTALATQDLVWNGKRLEWRWTNQELSPELPLWLLSLSAANLMISPEMDRVRACENPECSWLFLDTSKNHTRRWCQMSRCGNRMKVRRFKAQQRQPRRRPTR